MAQAALALFALAALGGLFLAYRHFKGASLPMPVALVHGFVAATGLVLVALAYFQGGGPSGLGLALGALVVAALGGFFLFSFHLRGKRAPSAGVVVHALVAVTAVVLLLTAVL